MNFKLLFLLPGVLLASEISLQRSPQKPLVVLITSYNNQNYVERNLTSVFKQDYANYRIIYVDDCSTDQTRPMVQELSTKFRMLGRFTYVRNHKRMGALANIYFAVHSCKDNEIIISLDGDDWFPNSHTLRRVNEAYASRDVWMTHGSMIEFPHQATGWSIPIPKDIIDKGSFRTYRCPSHLRTFYAWLFKRIRVEDLMYHGKFFPMTWDQALMFPMIEMAGERHQFIPDILYVYNMANVINDNKVNPTLQQNLERYIRSMPRYPRLKKSPLE